MATRSAPRAPLLRAAAWVALVCLLLIAGVAFAVSKPGIEALAGFATGTHISIGKEDLHWTYASLDDVNVRSSSGEPLLHAAHVAASYDLRDLLPGGKRLYGLRSFDVQQPQLTLIRHKDGSWNYTLPSSNSKGAAGPPADFDGTIRDGRVTVIDQSQGTVKARALYADRVNADLHLHTASRSHYTVAASYIEDAHRYAINGVGDINPRDGYSTQHFHIPAMPIARIVDVAVNSPSLHLASGAITGSDVRILALPDEHGDLHSHITATTVLQHVRVAVGGLVKPIRELHGRIDLYDNGMTFDGVDGALASVPLQMHGGIYNLSKPNFRLALHVHGDLDRLRAAIAQAAHLPMRGPVDLAILLEGPASNVLAMIAVDGKRIDYAGTPIDAPHGLIAFNAAEFDLLDVHARMRGASLGAQGRVALTNRPNAIDILAGASAPASAVPYASHVVPGMPLNGMVLATADDPKHIETHGVIRGTTSTQQLDAAFAVDNRGVGTVGPLVLAGSRGSLYGEASIDHPHNHHAGFIDARGVRIAGATLDLNMLGTVDRGKVSALFGNGHVRGSLAALHAFAPTLAARGSMDAPVFAYSDGRRIIGQIEDAHLRGASVNGIALQGVSATIASDAAGHVNVLAAHARVANRDVLASGKAISVADVPALHGAVSAGAFVSGTASAPIVTAALVADGVQYGHYGIGALSSVRYTKDRLGLSNTAVDAGPALVMLDGTVHQPQSNARSYDLAAHTTAAHVQQQRIDASVDANVHVGGSGMSPLVTGSVHVPTGSVNGQGFRDLRARVNGTPQNLAFSNGDVMVDTTNVHFSAVANAPARAGSVAMSAPHADLSDFNDLFDTGETLGGTGRLAMSARYAPGAPLSTSGSLDVRNFRYRRYDIGSTAADWNTSRGAVQFVVAAGGAAGTIRARGSVNTATYAMATTATVRGLDLATWLPLAGVNAPVLGRVDADATTTGEFLNMNSRINAHVIGASAWGVPVQQATLAMHTTGGRGTVDRAFVRIAHATADASGTFGLHARDPLNIVAHANSSDIGALAHDAGMKATNLGGRVATTATLHGTRANPQIADTLIVDALTYQQTTIPHASAQLAATTKRLTLQRGEVDLQPGRVLLAGSVPLPMRDAPFTASVVADDVELAQFAALMPSGTKLSGRLDGRVVATGDTDDPQFGGAMTLDKATYSSPMEEVPITNAHARLAFHGTTVDLRDTSADLGGGRVVAAGTASVPSVRDLGALAFNLQATADNARVDAPSYYKGLVNGRITARRPARGMIALGGDLALSSGRVPLTALYNPKSSNAPAAAPPPIAFDNLHITVGRDVRVQSPNVDVGAEGAITVANTLAAPHVSGSFVSTGGTLSFYRTFSIEDGTVSFDGTGIVPNVSATAITYVSDPQTAIRIRVNGPATNMNLALASDPPYDRTQILGLLAGVQQYGALQGVAYAPNQQPNMFASFATGELNTLFTRNLLEPLSTALGGAFGLSNVQLTDSFGGGGFGANLTKAIGKHVNFIFAESFGQPHRQSLTLETKSSRAVTLRADMYTQDQPLVFSTLSTSSQSGLFSLGPSVRSIEPMSGTSGFDLELQRKFP